MKSPSTVLEQKHIVGPEKVRSHHGNQESEVFKEVAAVVSFNPSLWFGKPDPAAFDA